MQLSCRGRYATRAMLELAKQTEDTPVPLSKIAKNQNISRMYLQQLMGELKRVGLVRVVQGFKGGFNLTRPADQISLADILNAVEGEFALVDCLHKDSACDMEIDCLTRDVWKEATAMLQDYFNNIFLKDLLERNIYPPKIDTIVSQL